MPWIYRPSYEEDGRFLSTLAPSMFNVLNRVRLLVVYVKARKWTVLDTDSATPPSTNAPVILAGEATAVTFRIVLGRLTATTRASATPHSTRRCA